MDDLYEIVVSELEALPAKLRKGLLVTKSYNSTTVEVNYEGTWAGGEMGLPIFAIEDMYAGSNIFQTGCAQMGIIPTIAYDGNIFISPGLGTCDPDGNVLERETRWAVKGLVALMGIVARFVGL